MTTVWATSRVSSRGTGAPTITESGCTVIEVLVISLPSRGRKRNPRWAPAFSTTRRMIRSSTFSRTISLAMVWAARSRATMSSALLLVSPVVVVTVLDERARDASAGPPGRCMPIPGQGTKIWAYVSAMCSALAVAPQRR